MVAEQYSRGRSAVVGSGDQSVVDQGEFVAEAFEALPHRHLLIRF
jgi:hypothetical protein